MDDKIMQEFINIAQKRGEHHQLAKNHDSSLSARACVMYEQANGSRERPPERQRTMVTFDMKRKQIISTKHNHATSSIHPTGGKHTRECNTMQHDR